MKNFSSYQYIDGEMNDRDKEEVGSKYWNKGKWDNLVLPFLPKDCSEMTLVDMGCNAGLFLKLAEDKGFKTIGVDSNSKAIELAIEYKKRNKGGYQIIQSRMEDCDLPIVDYTIFVNSHYYFDTED